MRTLLTLGLLGAGLAFGGCHHVIHHALHHHHVPHISVRPRPVVVVKPKPVVVRTAPRSESSSSGKRLPLPHEILKERHKEHMKVLKKIFD